MIGMVGFAGIAGLDRVDEDAQSEISSEMGHAVYVAGEGVNTFNVEVYHESRGFTETNAWSGDVRCSPSSCNS